MAIPLGVDSSDEVVRGERIATEDVVECCCDEDAAVDVAAAAAAATDDDGASRTGLLGC